ncbi:hypothetical protein TcYC6_0090510 [Trypanosoma cruzi]|nr:hypothetical protein TcYC6_0090510 [Trypanosoma cruzi]
MPKMMNACFFGLLLITAVAGVHAVLPFTEPKGPMPDTIELAESALAPFMAFDGGHLYLSKGQQDIPVVCGSESSAKSRIVLPVTLNDLDRLHGTLPVQRLNQTSTASEAQLDIVEGCYVLPEGKDRPCVASLNSTPEQCNMNIRDSTVYWTYRERLRKTQNSSQILRGGADLLVNHVLWVHGLRARLRRSIRRTREVAEAGKTLWKVVVLGWDKNTIQEDKQAFLEAVSARGRELANGAYAEVMDKWMVVRQWMKTSVGEVESAVNTFSTENGGSLLGPHAYCNPSTYFDKWLNYSDETLLGDFIASSVEQDLDSLFRGFKFFYDGTPKNLDPLGRLPCITTSFALAMMLFEDFPIRLAYGNMMNGTDSTNALWSLERFKALGDSNEIVTRNRKYMLDFYERSLVHLSTEPHVKNIFDGNVSLAECVTQAIRRAPGLNGTLPPSSLYECFSTVSNSFRGRVRGRGTQNATDASVDVATYVELPAPLCPWGYTRRSGNKWNAREECVMCPPGSFDDGNGDCRCSAGSVPGENGCKATEHKYAVPPSWKWVVNSLEGLVASDGPENRKPVLVVNPQNNPKEDEKTVLEICCTRGLTRFVVEMMMPGNSTTPSLQRFILPPQNSITVASASTISLSLAGSAAFGGEQCKFGVWTKSSRSQSSQVVRAGIAFIVPSISKLNVSVYTPASTAHLPTFPAPGRSLPLCDALPKADPETATLAACSTSTGEFAISLLLQEYKPLTASTFGILKQRLWVDGKQAATLGRSLRPVLKRMHLAVRIRVGRRNSRQPLGEGFIGSFPLSEVINRRFLMPKNIERVVVEVQVLDRCTFSASAHNPVCAKAKILFAPGEVKRITFDSPTFSGTITPGDTENGEQQQPSKSPGPWWRLTLIVLGTVVVVLLIPTAALFLWYRRRFR